MPGTEATDLLTLLMSNPVTGGGTIVSVALGVLVVLLKGYNLLRKDQAGADAIQNSFATQKEIIDMLRTEIARLNDEVSQHRQEAGTLSDSHRQAMDDNVRLIRDLEESQRREHV